jgi:hypothetical protein
MSIASFMHFYNQISSNEAERSQLHFSSRHSANLVMAFSSRKSRSRQLMDVIVLHISDKLTVCRSCQSIDIVRWFPTGPDSEKR